MFIYLFIYNYSINNAFIHSVEYSKLVYHTMRSDFHYVTYIGIAL